MLHAHAQDFKPTKTLEQNKRKILLIHFAVKTEWGLSVHFAYLSKSLTTNFRRLHAYE